MSRATLTGPMMMNLSAFQHAHSTMRWSQPGVRNELVTGSV